MDAIILCGGSSWRLKPDVWVPKPKLKINDETLISHQVSWLKKYEINRIILATDTPDLIDNPSVVYSIEEKKLGTGGAVKKAAEHVRDARVYVMNVDDIVFYDPKELYEYSGRGAAILMAKPTLPFGKIRTLDTYVLRFEQKPLLDFYVCYDEDTEVLTKAGWKYFSNLRMNDQIATLRNGTLEYQYPTRIINEPYDGEMISIKNRMLDLMVTPNHKLYCRTPTNREYTLVEAIKRFQKPKVFLKTAEWNGDSSKWFRLPSVKVKRKILQYKIPERKIPIVEWLKFFGFWLAEGWTTRSKRQNGFAYRVGIASSDESRLKKYQQILSKIGYTSNISGHCLEISNKQLWMYLHNLGNAHSKFIPEKIKNLSKNLLSILLYSYLEGDGTICETYMHAFTSSKRLRDDLQEIALKLGYSSSYRINRKKKDKATIRGREIVARETNWAVSFTKHREIASCYNATTEKLVPYKGNVYCVEVPNHIIYVRRNGIPVWCGNSAGHYVFKTSVIKKYFPEKGDMELQTLQNLADKKTLRGYRYNGLWLTINTAKDLYKAREYFKHRKNYES